MDLSKIIDYLAREIERAKEEENSLNPNMASYAKGKRVALENALMFIEGELELL